MTHNNSQCAAFLGTGSDVGKSIVCTAICRILSNLGVSVAPFKAQNMSNNSWVTTDGGEMGRAQVVQAEAARVDPHVDMNPILLKPSADTGSQVILHGHAIGNCTSKEYWNDTAFLFGKAQESLHRLQAGYDVIIMEGAGSCGEVNLRDRDFVNFRMAHAADAQVILVADIDRGGVFAQIIGTLDVIPPEDREIVKGIIINKFRGDPDLFDDGIKYIEERTGLSVLGLIPYFYDIDIDSEDGVILDAKIKSDKTFRDSLAHIAVLKLPHISNFTDFNALQRDESVYLRYLYNPESLNQFDCVILPGTKNVRFDLGWLRERGWENHLREYVDGGGMLVGICGGYQMLGRFIRDPHGMEGGPGETRGFGFLDCETLLTAKKNLSRITGIFQEFGNTIDGYEIHMGITSANYNLPPVIHITTRNGDKTDEYDGAISKDGRIWGCYIHGLFDDTGFRKSFLQKIRPEAILQASANPAETITAFKDRQYNQLAQHFTTHFNLTQLWKIIGLHFQENHTNLT